MLRRPPFTGLLSRIRQPPHAKQIFQGKFFLLPHILTENLAGKKGIAVHWKKIICCFCLLSVLTALSGPAETRQAAAPAEVTVDRPPLVALTFDDGPRASTTGPLLDGLALREVPATFFLVGSRIPGNEDLIRRMAAEGHQIGVHTFDHVKLEGLSHQDFDLQISRTQVLLDRILGPGDYWLRPPYGLIERSEEDGIGGPLILWSVDPEDWKDENIDRIVAAIVDHASDGDIILLHDLFPSSAQAALVAVDALLEKGFCFVTVEQLMQARGVAPEAGVRYRKFPPAEN